MYSGHSKAESSPWEQKGKRGFPGMATLEKKDTLSSADFPLYHEWDVLLFPKDKSGNWTHLQNISRLRLVFFFFSCFEMLTMI